MPSLTTAATEDDDAVEHATDPAPTAATEDDAVERATDDPAPTAAATEDDAVEHAADPAPTAAAIEDDAEQHAADSALTVAATEDDAEQHVVVAVGVGLDACSAGGGCVARLKMPGGGGSGSRGFGSNKANTSYDQFRSDISKKQYTIMDFPKRKTA